ncbi:hypothetical protein GGI43DRAFT_425740 [Trichoderma evansii]
MRATPLALLTLWLSASNYNGACAQSIQPLDRPIKAVSSGEFGLPQELHVVLHSHLPVHGRDGEAIVLGTYSGDSNVHTKPVEDHENQCRGLWSFVWAATKVLINPISWTSGIQLADLACQALGWWTSAPSNEGSYQGNLESLQLQPYYSDYGNIVDNVGRGLPSLKRGSEPGYYDWSVLHPHLANKTISNAISGKASILHDTNSNPLLIQRSINGTLLGRRSAGLGSHHAFGTATGQSTKRDSGNCMGFGNDSGDIYADNQGLCGGDGTDTEDGITGVYYGMDFYGTESQWEEYDADVGGQYPDSNGAWEFASELSDDLQNSQWWHTCLCDQESSTYSWTGALQYTWNGGFNGYNDCYSGVCGGAS